MREFVVTEKDEGQTLTKYLSKILPLAGGNVLFKALRKKNITLNNGRAAGREVLKRGDCVKVFFSEETLGKFLPAVHNNRNERKAGSKELKGFERSVIYEDKDILIVNKESGILSQGDASGEISLNDLLLSYLENETRHYAVKPSVCNRLDRNTSGLVLCGKTQKGLKALSEMLKDRSIKKYYYAVVLGELTKHLSLKGYLYKDREENRAYISETKENADAEAVNTEVSPVSLIDYKGKKMTLVKAELITGKPHQIRAHMLYAGFPVIGDPKYFNEESLSLSGELKEERQLLHAVRVEFPRLKGEMSALSNKSFEAPLPGDFNAVLKYTVKTLSGGY